MGDEFRFQEVLEGVSSYLLTVGMDQKQDWDVGLTSRGAYGELQVLKANGDIAYEVIGKDSHELGVQLALACLQSISIDRLRALREEPLNNAITLQNRAAADQSPSESTERPFLSPLPEPGTEEENDVSSYQQVMELVGSVMENMAQYLLGVGVGDYGEKSVAICRSGDLLHLRLLNSSGEILYQVVGKNSWDVGGELALAALHKLSIDQLRSIHNQPLKKKLQLMPTKSRKFTQ